MYAGTQHQSTLWKQLTCFSFPEKLYRLLNSEKYRSIWWSDDGSHFIVDVPKFEQEVLRSDAVPETDGFRTICFNSFIRQLNLYGFRKVRYNSTHKYLSWLKFKVFYWNKYLGIPYVPF